MKRMGTISRIGSLTLALGLGGCGQPNDGDVSASSEEPVVATTSALRADRGDLLVTLASEAATVNGGRLARVSLDGRRTILSDFADPSQGPLGVQPFGVEVENSGTILVLDRQAGTGGTSALFRVNPRNGARTILSNFGDPSQGPVGHNPEAFSVDARGNIIVAGENHPAPATALLVFSIDPVSGHRRVVSDFGNPAQGPVGAGLERAAAIPGDEDHLLVTDRDFGPTQNGALFVVNRRTGHRVVISDFGDLRQGPTAANPEAFVFQPGNKILLTDENEAAGALFLVDYVTGKRSKLSTWNDPSEGPVVSGVEGLGEGINGDVFGAVPEGGATEAGAIYRIDQVTGVRFLVTDFGDATEGPAGEGPLYVTGFFPGSGQLQGAVSIAIGPEHHGGNP